MISSMYQRAATFVCSGQPSTWVIGKTEARSMFAPQQAMCRFAAVPTPNSPEPFTLQRIPAHSAIFATVRAGYRPPALVT